MKKLLLLVLPFTLFACHNTKHPGYTQAEPGVFYKLITAGESGKKAGPEDYYEVRMQNKSGGVVFFDSQFENARGTLLMQSASSKYFSVLGEGDSATFLLPGGDLQQPGVPDTGMIEMNVKVVRILSPGQAAKLQQPSDPDLDEQVLIRRYMNAHHITAVPDSTGLIFISEKAGTGASPVSGSTVKVEYTGWKLNGKMFDNYHREDNPFIFHWGDEDQVLPGIERALGRMKAGGKAKLILPSALAFGPEGSSTGIVPPHTPVVYEVELVSVEQP